MKLICAKCFEEFENLEIKRCLKCNDFLFLEYKKRKIKEIKSKRELGIWIFKNFLPKIKEKISLGEGNTPIIKAIKLSKIYGIDLFIKNESLNPTGSFMDRGSAVYISFLKERNVNKIKLFSTGNFGASISAYAAKAGIENEIFIPKNINYIKLYQMINFGSKIEIDKGKIYTSEFITQADPLFLEGLKTQIFEIFDFFKKMPDYIILPVGSGCNLFSFYKGYKELKEEGFLKDNLKIIGIKLTKKLSKEFLDLDPSYLYCKSLINLAKEITEIEEVNSEEVINSASILAKNEGIMVELVSATALAGLIKIIEERKISKRSKVLLILTGTGLKETLKIKNLEISLKEKEYKSKKVGLTKIEILKILKEESLSGYEIWKKLKEKKIKIKLPTIYEHLKQLEDANLIFSLGYVKKKNRIVNIHSITEFGKKIIEK